MHSLFFVVNDDVVVDIAVAFITPTGHTSDVQELRINSEAFSLIPSEDEAKGWDTSALANAGQCILVDEEGATPSVPGHIQRQLSVRPIDAMK